MSISSLLHNPKNRLIAYPLVELPDAWPKAPSQYGFIFEAINLVGANLFVDEWNKEELRSVIWLESPKAKRLREKQAFRPSKIPRSLASYPDKSSMKAAPIEHVVDWIAEKRNKDWESNNRATERLRKTVDWIAQRCRDGDLTSYARLQTGGGNLMPMRASEWNIDDPLGHFVANGGHKRHCIELPYSGPFETFVFFRRQELQELLARQPDAPLVVSEADLSRLSPYLRLAIHVALKRGYFDGSRRDTQDAREAEVRAAWPDFIPNIDPVKSTVQQIAKLMAFPDPKAIRDGQKGAQLRKTG